MIIQFKHGFATVVLQLYARPWELFAFFYHEGHEEHEGIRERNV